MLAYLFCMFFMLAPFKRLTGAARADQTAGPPCPMPSSQGSAWKETSCFTPLKMSLRTEAWGSPGLISNSCRRSLFVSYCCYGGAYTQPTSTQRWTETGPVLKSSCCNCETVPLGALGYVGCRLSPRSTEMYMHIEACSPLHIQPSSIQDPAAALLQGRVIRSRRQMVLA